MNTSGQFSLQPNHTCVLVCSRIALCVVSILSPRILKKIFSWIKTYLICFTNWSKTFLDVIGTHKCIYSNIHIYGQSSLFTDSYLWICLNFLNLICNSKINTMVLSRSFRDTGSVLKKLRWSMYIVWDEIEQGNRLPSCFSCHHVSKCPLCSLFTVALLSFLLVILLFKIAFKHSFEVLSSFPKCKEAVMCLM